MEIDILTEDEAWLAVPEREALARGAVRATFEALDAPEPESELSIVFAGDAAVAELNRLWRGKEGSTNVLSFPAAAGRGQGPSMLGDIVLAAVVIRSEALSQGKPLENHTAHLIIHGVLHLLGHDHGDDSSAEAMERLEVQAMRRLGLPDPYEEATAPGCDPGPRLAE